MPKNAKNVVAKKATKKSTKKVAKRVVAKRARVVKPTAAEVDAQAQRESLEQASVILGTALHQAAEAAMADNGQFSANGMLNLNVRNSVQAARSEVVIAIRGLVEASIELSDSASLSQSARDVATAAQRLAAARVELALDGLESVVRG